MKQMKLQLSDKLGLSCITCDSLHKQFLSYGYLEGIPIYKHCPVVYLGGSKDTRESLVRLFNTLTQVWEFKDVSYWPAQLCVSSSNSQSMCSNLTRDKIKTDPNLGETLYICSQTSLFKDTVPNSIVISDDLYTDNHYATLKLLLIDILVNGHPERPDETTYTLLPMEYDAGEDILMRWMSQEDACALDIEGNTLYPHAEGADLFLIQITGKETKLKHYPVWNKTQTVLFRVSRDTLTNYPTLEQFLRTHKFILHNATFDSNFLKVMWGFDIQVELDTMLLGHLCKEHRPHGLTSYYAKEVLNWGDYDSELKRDFRALKALFDKNGTRVKPSHKNNPIVERPNYSDIDFSIMLRYSALDTQATWQIKNVLLNLADRDNLEQMYGHYDEMRRGLAIIQDRGAFIDRPRLQWLDDFLVEKIKAESSRFQFNVGSPKQVGNYLFNELGLKQKKSRRWKSGSVSEEALEHLLHIPDVRDILSIRTYMKMRSTYSLGFLESMYPDGRIRPNYNIISAKTGRISATNPPLQTIPRPYKRVLDGLDIGGVVRSSVCQVFDGPNPHDNNWINRSDWHTRHKGTIVAGDLSQAELRALAALSGDKFYSNIYLSGRDLHSEVAARLAGKDWETWKNEDPQAAKKWRSIAKTLNFGFAYGGDPYGLALRAGADEVTARIVAREFVRLTEDYTRWKIKCAEEVMRKGYVRSRAGRIRRWYNRNGKYAEIMRKAPNFLIQSLTSDITNLAAARLALQGYEVFLIWHDGIYIYADHHEVDEVGQALTSALCGAFKEFIPEIPVKMDLEIHPRIYMFGKE